MKPHPALVYGRVFARAATVTLINAGRRQRALRNVWGKPKHLEFIINKML